MINLTENLNHNRHNRHKELDKYKVLPIIQQHNRKIPDDSLKVET